MIRYKIIYSYSEYARVIKYHKDLLYYSLRFFIFVLFSLGHCFPISCLLWCPAQPPTLLVSCSVAWREPTHGVENIRALESHKHGWNSLPF